MKITVNGEPKELEDGTSVEALLLELEITGPGIAVELNREIVPKSTHAATTLAEGDSVEIVRMAGGG